MKLKWIATCTSAFFLVGLFASSLASAQGLPVRGGVIHACVKTKGAKKQRGTIRVVSSASKCKRKKGELPVTWNLQGPAGAVGTQGAAGAQGAPGAPGTNGSNGATGARGETGSAAAVEGQLREVISKQSKEIEKLTGGLIDLNAELGTLETTLGNVEKTLTSTAGGLTTLEGGVGGLEKTVTGTVKGLTSLEGGLGGLEKTVGEATKTLTGLGSSVTAQCNSLTEVGKQGNGLLVVVGKVLGVPAISTILGSVETPKETKPPIC